MSLLVVGSCSKITQNIIHAISRSSLYSTVTISDLLPHYDFHLRYYQLRKQLKQQSSSLTVNIEKHPRVDDLYHSIQSHKDVLFVTHDYFQSVVSKTKLMELTAQYSKKKQNVVFATPVEYDHYGYKNPEENYLNSQKKVLDINSNATFIRSDLQDGNQLINCLNNPSRFNQKIQSKYKQKIVSYQYYAEQVVQTLKQKPSSRVINIQGQAQVSIELIKSHRKLQEFEYKHHWNNASLFINKYKGINDNQNELRVQKKA